jgi:hypothetical protein
LAVDGTNLYWVDRGYGRILQQPLAGGAVVTVATDVDPYVDGLAVVGGSVYWIGLNIATAPIGGGATTTLVAGAKGPNMAVDGVNVYWESTTSSEWLLMAQAVTGSGTPQQLANYIPSYPGVRQLLLSGMAVQDEDVYWFGFDSVLMTPTTGGTVTTLAGPSTGADLSVPGLPPQLVVDGASVYWPNTSGAESVVIEEMGRLGGRASVVTQVPLTNPPEGMVGDDTYLYWFDATGVIAKAPKAGGSVSTIVTFNQGQDDDSFIAGLAVDATSLYYSNTEGVWQVTPK